MSESKFLPFQDVNGDGLNDDCKDQLRIEEPKYCPTCIPNASALVPDWRHKTIYDPFLNEKNCKFQFRIKTAVISLSGGYRQSHTDAKPGKDGLRTHNILGELPSNTFF